MTAVLIKVYAAFWPAAEACLAAVRQAGSTALGHEEEEWVLLEGTLLRISFEGIHFPLDEVLEALDRHLPPDVEGKLDVLDLDGWTLTRYLRRTTPEGGFASSRRSLNHVLDYSGH